MKLLLKQQKKEVKIFQSQCKFKVNVAKHPFRTFDTLKYQSSRPLCLMFFHRLLNFIDLTIARPKKE